MRNLNIYTQEVNELANAKGFSSEKSRVWEMFALIHCEVSEAVDAYKKGYSLDEVGTELVDALIYILRLCSMLDVDIEALYRAKLAKNWERPYRYNTKRGER